MGCILVAEDDFKTRILITIILQRAGYHTDQAEDGRQALDVLDSDAAVDLMISDIMMPGVDGLQLLEQAQKDYPHIPVILLSGLGKTDWMQKALDKGAVSCLNKPFTQQQLVKVVGDVLRAGV